jgi:CubicO group peptidase (beta-lactamase class C family)
MSKQFTAMCVLLLAEEGKLSLTDDIRHYIPEIPDYGHLITIEHLVHHTSGIRDYLLLWMKAGKGYGDAGSIDEESSLALLARQPALDFVPGERYEYSNSNYFLLGTIVKRTSGESLREFARQNIFQPLGMKNTQFLDDQAIVIKNLATGHMLDSRGVPQPLVTGYHLVGDGGVYTTVEDLYRWDQNFYSNQLGKKNQNLIAQFYTRGRLNNGEPVDYASGVVRGNHDELTTIEHGGRFIGYRCDLIRFPERRLSVILLCNSDAIDAQKLSVDVADLFLKM